MAVIFRVAVAVYAYLMFCEDRQTFPCNTIGEANSMSNKTVAKYVKELEGK